jgi:uncharacterized membrane protein
MAISKPIWGALAGALLAILWVAFGGGAVLLVIALAVVGALIGVLLEHPGALISLLERLQER